MIYCFYFIELPRSFHYPDDYTPSVDSAIGSWDSSNTDYRFNDHCETTKNILVNNHQQHSNYQDAPTRHISRSKVHMAFFRF